ncbi:AarF/ABC1/UbiB kinase family protein [Streptomyces sp. TRM68367]|uniref:AarF/ABC1/UbiB kinase family protein n=1 Tax=Streptomyces sp. TRM68367 TaxID=2758415 RepID=UPI00165C1D75|nr:AarF/ABC1/UbiB kinase family protein [Streptomyces sp. TRM68367]MBC9731274.1 AarF/ABC1/UbiB kinase family protein [Streptomyces sp. TRM68367]
MSRLGRDDRVGRRRVALTMTCDQQGANVRAIPPRLIDLSALALRCGRVSSVVLGYGLAFGASAVGARLRRSPHARGLRDGDRWVRMLTRLGPSYIKIGQLLSTRRDLLPDDVTQALSRLTDGVTPPSRRRIERAVRRSYRNRPWPFREFRWEPLACGSIATVHEA